MKISREVKVSDDNYGNTTQRLEFTVTGSNVMVVTNLLNQWEALVRRGVQSQVYSDSMTVRQMKEFEQGRLEMENLLSQLAQYEES